MAEIEEDDRDLDSLVSKVEGWELAFIFDGDAEVWKDFHLIDPKIFIGWEFMTEKLLKFSSKRHGDEGQALHQATMSVGMLGKGLQRAEFLFRLGKILLEEGDFQKAALQFKVASDLFFRAGDRKLSEMAKSWVRRAKVSELEESAESILCESFFCACVCRRIRAFETVKAALRRKAIARMDWRAAAEGHLNLSQGDVIDVIAKEYDLPNLDPDIVWYRGRINDKEGAFPTTQLLYKVSGRPLLDFEGRHRYRTIVQLQPSDIFAKYSQGQGVPSANVPSAAGLDEGDDVGIRDESLDSVMDCREFCTCLQDLDLMAPEGQRPEPVQLRKDDAVRIFREANRAEGADDDASNCTFEEFEDALERVLAALDLGSRAEIERSGPGNRACSLGERQLEEALRQLNEAHRLIGGVDAAWQTLLGHKARRAARRFAEFQEAHARQLTAGGRYDWAAEKYAHARRLFSGDTGAVETAAAPDTERLAGLQRAFTVNQYRMAMQFLALTAPNGSSHRGVPRHVGDARDKAGQMGKALAVFTGLGDHIAAATVWRADCELRLRRGEPEAARRAAVECMNEHSRLDDGQGLAAAYRLLAEVQLVQGQVPQLSSGRAEQTQSKASLAEAIHAWAVRACCCGCEAVRLSAPSSRARLMVAAAGHPGYRLTPVVAPGALPAGSFGRQPRCGFMRV